MAESDGEFDYGYRKRDRMLTGVRFGVKSNSRISSWVNRSEDVNTVVFHRRIGTETSSVEVGEERFDVDIRRESWGATAPYSLDKRKRWEMIDTLGELEEANEYERRVFELEAQRARARRRQHARRRTRDPSLTEDVAQSEAASALENLDDDAPGQKMYIVKSTHGYTTLRATRNAETKWYDAPSTLQRSQSDGEADSPPPRPTHKIVKTRKGDVVVPLRKHKPRYVDHTNEDLAQSDFMATITQTASPQHQKRIRTLRLGGPCSCPMCSGRSNRTPRVHKYRELLDQ